MQPSVDEYMATGYSYSRSGNPTVRALEIKAAALEGGADAAPGSWVPRPAPGAQAGALRTDLRLWQAACAVAPVRRRSNLRTQTRGFAVANSAWGAPPGISTVIDSSDDSTELDLQS